ncbi:MAG: cytochrome c oxidase subunit 3 [Planctomycetota bacterium]|jgi:cytochrome c oxidase subunit 3|nr:cytochrome c oxidase subunit 3 [Planctomycetota bacterium]
MTMNTTGIIELHGDPPVDLAPRETGRDRVNATLGMILFIGSWSMAFGTLFLSFLVLRDKIAVWPPAGIALPSAPIAGFATLVLAASSVFVERGSRSLSPDAGSGRKASFSSLWITGMLLGLGFALLQAWLWYDLILAGRTQTSGLYESLFFGLTWVHAVHVVVGLFLLVWALVGSKLGRYGPERRSFVSNAALFWHFVGIVWLFLFLGFFVF